MSAPAGRPRSGIGTGKHQFGMPRDFSGLGAEPARDFLDVQAKRGRVGAQETRPHRHCPAGWSAVRFPAPRDRRNGFATSRRRRTDAQPRRSRAARRSAPARGASEHSGNIVSVCGTSSQSVVFNDTFFSRHGRSALFYRPSDPRSSSARVTVDLPRVHTGATLSKPGRRALPTTAVNMTRFS